MPRTTGQSRSWTRPAIIALVVCAAVVLLAGKFWIAPALVRWQIRASLGEVWQGQVRVGEVEFNFLGPLRIRGLELRDVSGNKWIEIASVELSLGDWPSLGPVLRGARIEGVRVRAHFRDGKAAWPLKRPEREPKKKVDLEKYLDVQNITVRDISVGMVYWPPRAEVWEGLRLTVDRQAGGHRIRLLQQRQGEDDEEIVSGMLSGKGQQTNLSLRMSRRMSGRDVTALLGALGIGQIREAEGAVSMDIRIVGDPQELDKLSASGSVALADGRLVLRAGPEVQDIRASLALKGRSAAVECTSAKCCGGTVTGDLELQGLFSHGRTFSGTAKAIGIDLRDLSESLAGRPVFTKGKAAAIFKIAPPSAFDAGSLRGRFAVRLRNADLYSPPLMDNVLQGIGLKQYTHLFSDLDGTFQLAEKRATVESFLMSSAVAAVRIAKGGTVNLETGNFDMYVLTLPADRLGPLTNKVPGINVASKLTETLSCWHVQGNWGRPDELKVRPAPLESLEPGVLRNVVEAGKRAGQDAAKFLDGLLRLLENGPLPAP